MKKFFLLLLVITLALIAGILYEKFIVQKSFGVLSILAVSVLAILCLLLFITLLLFETRHRELTSKIWILVVSLSLTYLVLDLVSGYFLIGRLSPQNIPDEYIHHRLVPNTKTRIKKPEYSYIQRVNNFGLRGRDINLQKAPGHYRILMLGDSFTMGVGVENEKTFSSVLEKNLNKNRNINNAIEVINAGIDSYSPILSYLQLKRDLGPLEPDLVVLNLDMSDLVQESAYRERAIYGEDGAIIGVKGWKKEDHQLTTKIRHWINNNLYFSRLVLFYILDKSSEEKEITVENAVELAHPMLLKHTLVEDSNHQQENWQYIFESIFKIKKYCVTKGISFLLTIYPWGHQVNKFEWTPGRYYFIPKDANISDRSVETIQGFSSRNNIAFLNLFPPFRSYSGDSPLYFSQDMHWTHKGHEIMAEELERYILKNYFEN